MKTKNILKFLSTLTLCMFGCFVAVDLAADLFPVVSELAQQFHIIEPAVPGISLGMAVFSIPKTDENAGRVKAKDNTIIVFDWDDVNTISIDSDGITVSTDITFKAGASAIGIYATSSTIAAPREIEGEDDAKGERQHINFSHPGDEKAIRVARNELVNKNLGILVKYCDSSKSPDLFGTPCNPMQMGGSVLNDNTGTKNMFEFTSQLAANPVLIYEGADLVLDSGSGGGIQTA